MKMALAVAAIPLIAAGAQAATITQSFTLTISPAATLYSFDYNAFASSPFAEFNPADGRLTGISATLTGDATLVDVQPHFDFVDASLVFAFSGEEVVPDPTFASTNPGMRTISFALSGLDSYQQDFAFVTGTSTTVFDLVFDDIYSGDTVATSMSGLTGSITYDYRPAGAVPEPASWAMMLAGFFGLGTVLRRRRETGPAAACKDGRPA